MKDWTAPELTQQILEDILTRIGDGHRPKTAASLSNVHPEDFDEWIARGQEAWERRGGEGLPGDELYAQLYRMVPLVDSQGLGYWEGEYFKAVEDKEPVYAQNCLIVLKARWPEIWEKGPKEAAGEDRFEDDVVAFMRRAQESKPAED